MFKSIHLWQIQGNVSKLQPDYYKNWLKCTYSK